MPSAKTRQAELPSSSMPSTHVPMLQAERPKLLDRKQGARNRQRERERETKTKETRHDRTGRPTSCKVSRFQFGLYALAATAQSTEP